MATTAAPLGVQPASVTAPQTQPGAQNKAAVPSAASGGNAAGGGGGGGRPRPAALTTGAPVSFSSLRHTLESVCMQDSATRVATLLDAERFRPVLDFFAPPSEASRKRVSEGKATFTNGEQVTLQQAEKGIATSLSKLINVKEEQCCELLRQYLRAKVRLQMLRPSDSDAQPTLKLEDIDTDALVEFYLDERLSLLQCLLQLVRFCNTEDHLLSSMSARFIDTLLGTPSATPAAATDALLDRLVAQLESNATEQIPPGFARTSQWQNRWVRQVLAERNVILRILFSLFYERLHCTPARLCSLLAAAQKTNMGRLTATAPTYDETLRALLDENAWLFILLCVSALHLEDVLDIDDMDGSALPTISPTDKSFLALHEAMVSLVDKDLNGPLLLAWGVFLQRLNDIDVTTRCWPDLTANTRAAFKLAPQLLVRAYDTRALDVLVTILASELLLEENITIAFKSVLKGLLNALLSAFQVQALPRQDLLFLVAFHIFNKMPLLCAQFWEQDWPSPGRRSLLALAASRFPLDEQPLPLLLRALSRGEVGATAVANELADHRTFTVPVRYPFPHDQMVLAEEGDVPMLRLTSPMRVGPGGLLELPAGTVGRIMSPLPAVGHATSGDVVTQSGSLLIERDVSMMRGSSNGGATDTIAVMWLHRFSMWRWLHALLAAHASPHAPALGGRDAVVLQHLLHVLRNVLLASPQLRDTLVEHIDSGVLSSSNGHASAPTLFVVLVQFATRQCAQCLSPQQGNAQSSSSDSLQHLAGTALECVAAALPAYPREVVFAVLRRSDLLPPTLQGTLHRLLTTREGPNGQYPVTSAFLDVLSAVMAHSVPDEGAPRSALHGMSALMRRASMPLVNATSFMSATMTATRNLSASSGSLAGSARSGLGGQDDVGAESPARKPYEELRDNLLRDCYAYCLRHLFGFDSWRFRRIRDKFTIGRKLLQLLVAAIGAPPATTLASAAASAASSSPSAPAWLRTMMRESFLGSSGIYLINPLLAIIDNASTTTQLLEQRQRFTDTLEVDSLVTHAFQLLLALLAGPQSEQLERAIQDRRVSDDSRTLVSLIADYALVPMRSDLPLLAIRTLAQLCSAKDGSGQPVSLVGYFGASPAHFCASLVAMLGDADVSEVFQEAIVQFLRVAHKSQTALTAIFLRGAPALDDSVGTALQKIEGVPRSSVLTALVHHIARLEDGNYDAVSIESLGYLVELWASRQHVSTLAPVAAHAALWRAVTAVLGGDKGAPRLMASFASDSDERQLSRSNVCLAYALSLVALQLDQPMPPSGTPAAAAHVRAWQAAQLVLSPTWTRTWPSALLRALMDATAPDARESALIARALRSVLSAYRYLVEVAVDVVDSGAAPPADCTVLLDSGRALLLLRVLCDPPRDDSDSAMTTDNGDAPLSLPLAIASTTGAGAAARSPENAALLYDAFVEMSRTLPLLVRAIAPAAPGALPPGGVQTAAAQSGLALAALAAALHALPPTRAAFDASASFVIIEEPYAMLLQACAWLLRAMARSQRRRSPTTLSSSATSVSALATPLPVAPAALSACASLVGVVHDALLTCLELRPRLVDTPQTPWRPQAQPSLSATIGAARIDIASAQTEPATALLLPLMSLLVAILLPPSSATSAQNEPMPAWMALLAQSDFLPKAVALALASLTSAASSPTAASGSSDDSMQTDAPCSQQPSSSGSRVAPPAGPRHALMVLQLLLELSRAAPLASLFVHHHVLSQFAGAAAAMGPRVGQHISAVTARVVGGRGGADDTSELFAMAPLVVAKPPPPPSTPSTLGDWDNAWSLLAHLGIALMSSPAVRGSSGTELIDQAVCLARAMSPTLAVLADCLPLPAPLPLTYTHGAAAAVAPRGLSAHHVALHDVAMVFVYHLGRLVSGRTLPLALGETARALFQSLSVNALSVVHQSLHILSLPELFARLAGAPPPSSASSVSTSSRVLSQSQLQSRALRTAVSSLLCDAVAVAWIAHTLLPAAGAARQASLLSFAGGHYVMLAAPGSPIAVTTRAVIDSPPSIGTLLEAAKLLVGDVGVGDALIAAAAAVVQRHHAGAGIRGSAPASAPGSAPPSPRLGATPRATAAQLVAAEQALALAASLTMQLVARSGSPDADADDAASAKMVLPDVLSTLERYKQLVGPMETSGARESTRFAEGLVQRLSRLP